MTLSVDITNNSNVDGEEIVQLYYKDKICKLLTPIRTLLDFKKVEIRANETLRVQFEISTESLGYYNQQCKYVVDPGDFDLYISGDGIRFKTVKLTCK